MNVFEVMVPNHEVMVVFFERAGLRVLLKKASVWQASQSESSANEQKIRWNVR